MTGTIVIIGAGQAGLQTAEALRAGGFAGAIQMYGNESYGPYHRPPLSKAWLAGEMQVEQLQMRAPELLVKKNIELHLDRNVVKIDRSGKHIQLDDGKKVEYSRLVIATGATPRSLNIPGGNAKRVHVLRSRADAQAIAENLATCIKDKKRVAVVGGGFIGLEVAATARKKGLEVVVLEAAPRLLGRVLSPALSAWYADLHRTKGTEVLLGAQIREFRVSDTGEVDAIELSDRRIPVGLVVVGIGVSANDSLARDAGLECDNGIVVDSSSRTNDPFVVAAGDCTVRRAESGQLIRLESVQNATEQGKSAAAALLGQPRPFIATPWFWSDQYDKKLQMAGLSAGANIWGIRGDMNGDSFSVYHFNAGNLLAVDSVNAAKDHLTARKLLDAGVSPSIEQVMDQNFNLADLLTK